MFGKAITKMEMAMGFSVSSMMQMVRPMALSSRSIVTQVETNFILRWLASRMAASLLSGSQMFRMATITAFLDSFTPPMASQMVPNSRSIATLTITNLSHPFQLWMAAVLLLFGCPEGKMRGKVTTIMAYILNYTMQAVRK